MPDEATRTLTELTNPLTSSALTTKLLQFKAARNLIGKGQIATMIFASRLARKSGLPINVDSGVVTEGEGQVKGLSKGAVQTVLKEYGINRVLAEEGGRTSRGSLGNIRLFLAFLNELHAEGLADLPAIERWWVGQAQRFFEAKPFALRFEAGHSLRWVIRDLLHQAHKRQAAAGGTMFVCAMLQHLIGAKLSLVLPQSEILHHGFSVSDSPTGRSGDFEVGGVSLHVTTAPGEAVMRKCAANLSAGRFPIVITVQSMLPLQTHLQKKRASPTVSTYSMPNNSWWPTCTSGVSSSPVSDGSVCCC